MAHLIDKDALVAEIESRIKNTNNDIKIGAIESLVVSKTLNELISFIDTLEVKEIDLEKEIKMWKNEHCVYGMDELDFIFAKHFFELGLKAQHDNWKVVDNTNHPQADKKKIYCVLSKNKYLLARVIGHPQDDDLLQWKCTEFPNYRYDMCEGDKYMQIV